MTHFLTVTALSKLSLKIRFSPKPPVKGGLRDKREGQNNQIIII